MPAEDIIKNLRITSQTGPVVDGYFLTKTPQEVFARGEEMRVPLIAGSNKDEGTFSQVPNTAAEWKQRAVTRFGGMADAYLKLYPPGTDAETLKSQLDAYRDEVAFVDRNMVRLHANAGQKAYLFYFTHEPPGPPLWPARGSGATHGGEAQFLFNNLLGNRPWRELDSDVARYMQSYWINFATTGDPNGTGLPTWAPYDDKKNVRPMLLGDKAEPGPAFDPAKLAFFDAWYNKTARGR
jgi:para-nitrobenzyl esterase